MYLRCQDCRIVTHPECRERCPLPCTPTAVSTPIKNTEVHFVVLLYNVLLLCLITFMFTYILNDAFYV